MMVLYMLTSETNVYACIDVLPQAASEISRMPSAKENGWSLHMYETLIPTQLKAQQLFLEYYLGSWGCSLEALVSLQYLQVT